MGEDNTEPDKDKLEARKEFGLLQKSFIVVFGVQITVRRGIEDIVKMARWPSESLVGQKPFVAVLFYFIIFMLIFWFGPLPWPVANVLEFVLFQLPSLIFLMAGYFFITGKTITNRHPINLYRIFSTSGVLPRSLYLSFYLVPFFSRTGSSSTSVDQSIFSLWKFSGRKTRQKAFLDGRQPLNALAGQDSGPQ